MADGERILVLAAETLTEAMLAQAMQLSQNGTLALTASRAAVLHIGPTGDDTILLPVAELPATDAERATLIGRSGAACKGQAWRLAAGEIGMFLAAGPAPVGKAQNMAVLAVAHEGRIVNRDMLLESVEIGERDKKVEGQIGRHQRGTGMIGLAHRFQSGQQLAQQMLAVKRRLEPARTGEQRQLVEDFRIAEHQAAEARARSQPQNGPHIGLAPGIGTFLGIEQARDIGFVEPEIAEMVDAQVMGQRTAEDDAVDSAGRCAGDYVDHDSQIDMFAQFLKQFEIGMLAVVFGIAGADIVGKAPRGPGLTLWQYMVGSRSPHEFEDLLHHAMHIDGERDAAEADQGEA